MNEIDFGNEITIQLTELTKKVILFTFKNALAQELYKVCSIYVHRVNTYYFVIDSYAGTSQKQVNSMEGYQPRPRNDSYANTYNLGWKNHPNFSWKGKIILSMPKTKYHITYQISQP